MRINHYLAFIYFVQVFLHRGSTAKLKALTDKILQLDCLWLYVQALSIAQSRKRHQDEKEFWNFRLANTRQYSRLMKSIYKGNWIVGRKALKGLLDVWFFTDTQRFAVLDVAEAVPDSEFLKQLLRRFIHEKPAGAQLVARLATLALDTGDRELIDLILPYLSKLKPGNELYLQIQERVYQALGNQTLLFHVRQQQMSVRETSESIAKRLKAALLTNNYDDFLRTLATREESLDEITLVELAPSLNAFLLAQRAVGWNEYDSARSALPASFRRRYESLEDCIAQRIDNVGRKPFQFLRHNKLNGALFSYAHFFGSIFLPVLEYAERHVINNDQTLILPDCYVMNTEVKALADLTGLDFFQCDEAIYEMAYEVLVHANAQHLIVSLPTYDTFWWNGGRTPDRETLDLVRKRVFSSVNKKANVGPTSAQKDIVNIVVVGRMPSADVFDPVDWAGGAELRDVPNLGSIAQSLKYDGCNVQYVYFEELTFKEKVRVMQSADIYLLQIGAAVTASYWMKPGSSLVEIVDIPYHAKKWDSLAAAPSLAEANQLRFRRIAQNGLHAPVNPHVVQCIVGEEVAYHLQRQQNVRSVA